MHAHTQTRAFSILYHASVANLSRTFFPIAKYCCLQFWSLRGVLSAHWGHISSEKRFVSIHKDLQHACFLTLAGCVKCQNGNCDVGSFCLRKVSRVFLEKSDFCFVLGSFFFFSFFLSCSQQQTLTQPVGFVGNHLGVQCLFLSNSMVSEWNGALHLLRQNAAIKHSIRRSVLALAVTNHIQKKKSMSLHHLAEQTPIFLIVQANTSSPLPTISKEGVE